MVAVTGLLLNKQSSSSSHANSFISFVDVRDMPNAKSGSNKAKAAAKKKPGSARPRPPPSPSPTSAQGAKRRAASATRPKANGVAGNKKTSDATKDPKENTSTSLSVPSNGVATTPANGKAETGNGDVKTGTENGTTTPAIPAFKSSLGGWALAKKVDRK